MKFEEDSRKCHEVELQSWKSYWEDRSNKGHLKCWKMEYEWRGGGDQLMNKK
jgi:hypothetical protein